MLFFGVVSLFFLAVSAEYCYPDVANACSTVPKSMWIFSFMKQFKNIQIIFRITISLNCDLIVLFNFLILD